MSKGKWLFKQSDVTKAVKATVKAGVAVDRVEIDQDGKIVIVIAQPNDGNDVAKAEKNEWDD